jgi:hypothetical protein
LEVCVEFVEPVDAFSLGCGVETLHERTLLGHDSN